ncbi:MAG TPA: putative nucleotidyltransferase substrate binding domain-containing protein [Rhodocyclaceae bacterium]|nr:CBS domain-containing protein [Rhodocyclaceae bacterium]HMV53728.1 putative nucleotidyltransferase substrate binding domain-containing protein [Rhodocyclaceae bacterium]HMZ84742.1 putative nucleotidyltransferase substrate binding domain-containing protein [Rhodocyclaceae bacterium]HNA04050.1 putative nucleotidyltransferase substrate binding domain-containing protein [Rhodocyclaceae bacterium]HNB77995.1 putative nucleotidyltransferase substrate binding domain-containing protein [Rhodocyclacea
MEQGESGVETQALLLARVRDVVLRQSVLLSESAELGEAARAMRDNAVSCVLVGSEADPGIVTSTDLRDALALHGHHPHEPIGPLARRPIVAIDDGALLLDALIEMERTRVKRLPVTRAGRIHAVLELGDLLSYFALHSNVILRVAGDAPDADALKPAFRSLVRMVSALQRIGMKPDRIGRLASEINRAIFHRVFDLVMPVDLRNDLCLIVMGSEGRAEQILPTDQDNALIVRDGIDPASLMPACRAFSEALAVIGYPPCAGNVMVSNPAWVLGESGFRNRIGHWIVNGSNDDVMNLAIFFDATAVAGDATLLAQVKAVLFEVSSAGDTFFARFASAINAFPVPINMFSRLQVERSGEQAGTLDIKKSGIFPIVQGIRSLALQHRLTVTGTLDRIDALVHLGAFDKRFARELGDAFGFLCTLRTQAGLAAFEAGQPATNRVRPADLSQIDQEVLVESLRVVLKLRKLITQHYRLDMLGF